MLTIKQENMIARSLLVESKKLRIFDFDDTLVKTTSFIYITHSNGKKLISQNENLDKVQLEALARSDEKVLKLQEAYKNEILLDVDVKNNNARNSYQSLQEKK